MAKRMLFNVCKPEEIRGAILDNKKLIEYDIEMLNREKTKNCIFVGHIVKIESSIQAVFVEYGAERHGFLPFGEIHSSFWRGEAPSELKRPNIEKLISVGQPVLVQVVREAIENKGAALTTFCSLPGRYLVLMPLSRGNGVSRKIEDMSARKQLQQLVKELKLPEGAGIIIRTAGLGAEREELHRELEHLINLWEELSQAARRSTKPRVIYQDSDLILRMIRDYFDSSVEEILIDDEEAYKRASSYLNAFMPDEAKLIQLYQKSRPLFAVEGVEEQVLEVYKRKIPLPSGGSICIDPTEALVSIDVNSGTTQSSHGTEETALKTNLEAGTEIARQLRLRDLGGLVVIDFIGLRRDRNIRALERHFRQAMKGDKARVKLGRISKSFGLLSMSRQRIRDAKAHGHFRSCPSCDGRGKIAKPEVEAMSVLRRLHDVAAQQSHGRLEARVPTKVAFYLLNQKREDLYRLESECDVRINILPRDGSLVDLERDLSFYPRTKPAKIWKASEPIQAAQPIPTRELMDAEREARLNLKLEEEQQEEVEVSTSYDADDRFPESLSRSSLLPEELPWFFHFLSEKTPWRKLEEKSRRIHEQRSNSRRPRRDRSKEEQEEKRKTFRNDRAKTPLGKSETPKVHTEQENNDQNQQAGQQEQRERSRSERSQQSTQKVSTQSQRNDRQSNNGKKNREQSSPKQSAQQPSPKQSAQQPSPKQSAQQPRPKKESSQPRSRVGNQKNFSSADVNGNVLPTQRGDINGNTFQALRESRNLKSSQKSRSSRQTSRGNGSTRQTPQGNGSASARQAPRGSASTRQTPRGSTSARQAPQGSTSARQAPQGSGSARQAPQGSGNAQQASRNNEKLPKYLASKTLPRNESKKEAPKLLMGEKDLARMRRVMAGFSRVKPVNASPAQENVKKETSSEQGSRKPASEGASNRRAATGKTSGTSKPASKPIASKPVSKPVGRRGKSEEGQSIRVGSLASIKKPSDDKLPGRRKIFNWTSQELDLLRSLQELPLLEAHNSFKEQGFRRSLSAFRSKFYQLARGNRR